MNRQSKNSENERTIVRLEQKINALDECVDLLKRQLRIELEKNQIFEKAFRVLGFAGNYIEFGAYRGESLVQAYYSGLRVLNELLDGTWNHSFLDPAETLHIVKENWNRLHFFAFDSFQGMPAPSGVDAEREIFPKGTYQASEEDFWATLDRFGVPRKKVFTVKGFFEDTCVKEKAQEVCLASIMIVHIDSDLYESARVALEFVTPYLTNSAVVIFDEWYQFFGDPRFGEQRAFREWRESHPEWEVVDFQKEGAYRNSFLVHRRKG